MGDSQNQSLARSPEERVACADPAFDDFICMKRQVWDCFYRTYVLKVPCEQE